MTTTVILEGLDCVGKTTIARSLAQAPNTAMLHASAPTCDNAIDEYVVPIAMLSGIGYSIVCDRWHLGELVWPQLFGRESIMDRLEQMTVERSLLNIGPTLLVWVVAQGKIVDECRKHRREPEYDVDKATELYREATRSTLLDFRCAVNTEVEKEVAKWKSMQRLLRKPSSES